MSTVTRAGSELSPIRAYYDETWLDYRMLWLGPRDLAIHFGYWDEHTRTHSESLLNMNRVLASRLDLRGGERILDAGCGIGGSALWLAREYGVEVVGITPVTSQVRRARSYAREAGLEARLSFSAQDYSATSFPDASFDVVWALESACHAPDKRRLLDEAHRVLRRGGRLGIVEYCRAARPLSSVDEALLRSWLSGWAIPDIDTQDEWLTLLSEAGFSDARAEDLTPNVVPSLRRLHRMAMLLWPGWFALRALGLRSKTQHGNARGARDQWRASRRGIWREVVLTARAA